MPCHLPRAPALLLISAALVSAAVATTIACSSEQAHVNSPQTNEAPPEPEVLSLTFSESASGDVHELALSWKPVPGIDRFVLCQTVPQHGTDCEQHAGVSQATVLVPGPIDDPQTSGTWLKHLWLQSCGEWRCSRPPTPAGTIAHRVVYGSKAWNSVAIIRRLTGSQVEVTLANASPGPEASTLILRTPGGSVVARCDNVAPGQWCGPIQGVLLVNEVITEQIYKGVAVTMQFPVLPSTTAPEYAPAPTP